MSSYCFGFHAQDVGWEGVSRNKLAWGGSKLLNTKIQNPTFCVIEEIRDIQKYENFYKIVRATQTPKAALWIHNIIFKEIELRFIHLKWFKNADIIDWCK